jgi:hypothetical protein
MFGVVFVRFVINLQSYWTKLMMLWEACKLLKRFVSQLNTFKPLCGAFAFMLAIPTRWIGQLAIASANLALEREWFGGIVNVVSDTGDLAADTSDRSVPAD